MKRAEQLAAYNKARINLLFNDPRDQAKCYLEQMPGYTTGPFFSVKLLDSSSIQHSNKQFCSTSGMYSITFLMKEEIQAVLHETQALSAIYQA